MFATIVGGALALVFIGLPLAIIGLFIQSLLERRNKRPAAGDVRIQAHRFRTLAGARRDCVGSTTFASAEHVGCGSPPRTGHPDRSPPSRCTNAAFRKGPQPCGAARTYFRSAFDGQCASVSGRSLNAGKRARSPRVTGSAVACCDDSCPASAASRSRCDAPPGRGSKAARLAIGMSRKATMGVVEKPARRPELFEFDHDRPRPPTLGCGFQQTPRGI